MAKDEKVAGEQPKDVQEQVAEAAPEQPGEQPETAAVAEQAAEESEGAGKKASKAAKKDATDPASVSRRTLMIGVGGTVALLGLGALRYVGHNPIVRPPGGTDEAHLVSACIRCEKCYEACPRKVIKPAKIEDGLLGMRSPTLNFETNYCDFCAEENGGTPLCVHSCPTQALWLPEGATAQNTVLGLAEIDTHTCLAYRDTGCHFCYDACVKTGYNAIELSGDGYSAKPVVVTDKCVGCGACESVCVSLQNGSIVEGATERAIKVRVLSD